jgi:hypothetical protein
VVCEREYEDGRVSGDWERVKSKEILKPKVKEKVKPKDSGKDSERH